MARRAIRLWVSVAASVRLLAFQPTFHADTRLVQINVVVHDKTGPVSNLTKVDFTLTDAGNPRTISLFSVVSARQSRGNVAPLPANTFSNHQRGAEPAPPSVTIILLDRLNTLIGPGSHPYEEHATWIEDQTLAYARQHLMRFAATLDAKDRVAIYSLGRSLTVLTDFTSDRERLHSVLENYRAVSLTSREDVEPLAVHTPVPDPKFDAAIDQDRRMLAGIANGSRAETTLAALVSIAAHVADIPGRKNLVWLTANLPFPVAAAARVLSRANVAVYPVDVRGLLPQAPALDENDVAARSVFGRNGVATGQDSQPTGIPTMQDLARETGGRAFINSNDLESGMRAAVEDAAVTYTLGFYADADSLDGKFHELKVRIKSGSYDVRYPRGYFAVRDEPAGNRSRLLDAILTPLESTAIGILARIEPVEQVKPGSLMITGAIDLHNLQLEQKANLWKGAADVYIVQQDAAGSMLDRSHSHYNLQLTDRLYADYLKSGVFFRQTITPKEGLATLRVLVADPRSSRIGSLIIPLGTLK